MAHVPLHYLVSAIDRLCVDKVVVYIFIEFTLYMFIIFHSHFVWSLKYVLIMGIIQVRGYNMLRLWE